MTYADIPLPFGEMHTENIGSTDLIRAAVVVQLAKPAVTPSPFWQITGVFKYQVLTWVGIIGSAITLFANLNGVLDLADWARLLSSHWHEWNQIVWGWLFGFIKVQIPKEFVPIITFTVFTVVMVIGVNLSLRGKTDLVNSKNGVKKKIGIFVAGVLLYLLATPTVLVVFAINLDRLIDTHALLGAVLSTDTASSQEPQEAIQTAIWYGWMLPGAILAVPVAYLLYFVKERIWGLIASIMFYFMAWCLLYLPLISEVNG